MKIFTLTSIAGAEISCPPGAVVDWPNQKEAERLIAGGSARKPTAAEIAVSDERKATTAAAEKAATEATKETAATVSKANKKRATDAKKADDKKRKAAGRIVGNPPKAKPAPAKTKTAPAE